MESKKHEKVEIDSIYQFSQQGLMELISELQKWFRPRKGNASGNASLRSARLSGTIGSAYADIQVGGLQPNDAATTEFFSPTWVVEETFNLDVTVVTQSASSPLVHNLSSIVFPEPGRYLLFAHCLWPNGLNTPNTPNGPSYAMLQDYGSIWQYTGSWASGGTHTDAFISGGGRATGGVAARGASYSLSGGYNFPEIALSFAVYHQFASSSGASKEARGVEFYNTTGFTHTPGSWLGKITVVRIGD